MSFKSLTESEIHAGEPVSNNTLGKVQDNFNDHEDRILNVEAGGSTVYPPIILRVNGFYSDQGPATGWLKESISFNMRITGVRLYIDKAGTANTTEVDIMVKRSGGTYESIFDQKPSVSFAQGDDAVSTNCILDRTKVRLQADDILRLDTTGVQDNGEGFMVRIDYEKIA